MELKITDKYSRILDKMENCGRELKIGFKNHIEVH